MVLVSYSSREINAKLVYYGPGLSGKTTNLEYIYGSIPQGQRGKMVSMKTKTERTLFFDFLPVDLGELSGFKTRFLLYTVPGQVYYNATRKLVLKGVDAVVFVADSKRGKMDENLESLQNLRQNLHEHGLDLDSIPWVIQYNKRDLPDTYTTAELEETLNPSGVPSYEAIATTGQGVVDTFKGIARILLRKLASETGVAMVGPKPGTGGASGTVMGPEQPGRTAALTPPAVSSEASRTASAGSSLKEPEAEPIAMVHHAGPENSPGTTEPVGPVEAGSRMDAPRQPSVGDRLRRWLGRGNDDLEVGAGSETAPAGGEAGTPSTPAAHEDHDAVEVPPTEVPSESPAGAEPPVVAEEQVASPPRARTTVSDESEDVTPAPAPPVPPVEGAVPRQAPEPVAASPTRPADPPATAGDAPKGFFAPPRAPERRDAPPTPEPKPATPPPVSADPPPPREPQPTPVPEQSPPAWSREREPEPQPAPPAPEQSAPVWSREREFEPKPGSGMPSSTASPPVTQPQGRASEPPTAPRAAVPDREPSVEARPVRPPQRRESRPREVIVPLVLEPRDLKNGVVLRLAIQLQELRDEESTDLDEAA